MCGTSRFCFCFSPQVGAMFVSSYMITLAGLGLLYTPFLPFSGEAPMRYILGYMLLLLATFLIALFGSWIASTKILMIAILLGLLSLLMWVGLTLPSFFTPDRPYCIGFRCGESHWFVPRQWNPHEDNAHEVRNFHPPRPTRKPHEDRFWNVKGRKDDVMNDTRGNESTQLVGLEMAVNGEDSNLADLREKEKNYDHPVDFSIDNIEMKLQKLKEKEEHAAGEKEIPDGKTQGSSNDVEIKQVENKIDLENIRKMLKLKNKLRPNQNPWNEKDLYENRANDNTRSQRKPQSDEVFRTQENEIEPIKYYNGNWLRYPKSVDGGTESDFSPDSPEFKRIERFLKLDFVGSGTIVNPKRNESEGRALDRLLATNNSVDNFDLLLSLFKNSSYINDKVSNPSFKDKGSNRKLPYQVSKPFLKDKESKPSLKDKHTNRKLDTQVSNSSLKDKDSNGKWDNQSEKLPHPEKSSLYSRRGRNSFSLPKGKYEERAHRFRRDLDVLPNSIRVQHQQRPESLLRASEQIAAGMALVYGLAFLFALCTLGMYLGHLRQEARAKRFCLEGTQCGASETRKSGAREARKCGSETRRCGVGEPARFGVGERTVSCCTEWSEWF